MPNQYPAGSNIQLQYDDQGVASVNPGFLYQGQENGALAYEQREINGVFYTAQNATWSKFAQIWSQVDVTKPSYATALYTDGSFHYLSSPANTTPFAWIDNGAIPIPPNANLSGLGTYNVKAYGATGDSVTDEVPFIKAAIAAAPVGAVIFLPPGSYNLASLVTGGDNFVLKDGQSFIGCGQNSTHLIASSPFDWIISNGAYAQVNPYLGTAYYPNTVTYTPPYLNARTLRVFDSTNPAWLTQGHRISGFSVDGGLQATGTANVVVLNGAAMSLVDNLTIKNLRVTPGGQSVMVSNSYRTTVARIETDNAGQGPTITRCCYKCLVVDCSTRNTWDTPFAVVGGWNGDGNTNDGVPIFTTFRDCLGDKSGATGAAFATQIFDDAGSLFTTWDNCTGDNNATISGQALRIHENLGSVSYGTRFKGRAKNCAGGGFYACGVNIDVDIDCEGCGFAGGVAGGTIISLNNVAGTAVVPTEDVRANVSIRGSVTGSTWGVLIENANGLVSATVTNIKVSGQVYDLGNAMANLLAIVPSSGTVTGVKAVNLDRYSGNATFIAGTTSDSGATLKITNCLGYNPAGPAVVTPALAATGVAMTNTTGVDAVVLIAGGTLSSVVLMGVATGQTAGSFYLPAGQTIAVFYTVAPTTFRFLGLN